jgi:ribosomal protein S18 acetylase RimI-like enzyme
MKSIGAAWLRLLTGNDRGYGYVDETTPELSIALTPEYRGKGIGSQLLTRLLENAKSHFSGICLSVHVDNPARHLYQRFGFEAVKEEGSSVVMVTRWR